MNNKIDARYVIFALIALMLCLCLLVAAAAGVWFFSPQFAGAAGNDLALQVEQTVVAQALQAEQTLTAQAGAGEALALQVQQTVVALQLTAGVPVATSTSTTAAAVVAAATSTNVPAAAAPTSTKTNAPAAAVPTSTHVPPTSTSVPPTSTNVPPTPTATPVPLAQLEKTSWQVDFSYIGGSHRLQVNFSQNGNSFSGSNRDNNAEVDISTSGTVTGNTVVITFTMSNGGSDRGTVTCTGTISGSPQTISGTFTAPSNLGVGATSGNCNFR